MSNGSLNKGSLVKGTGGSGGGGGTTGKIKILNVVETGALTRNGTVYSGFASDKYLQIGNKVDGDLISLDNAVKDFGAMTETANSWEMVWKFAHKSNNAGIIFACNVAEGNQLVVSDKLELDLSNENGNWSIGSVTGTTTLTIDTIYWVKVEFTGSAYIMSLSTNGINYTTEATITSSTKLTNRAVYMIGKNASGYPLGEDLDLSGCYIKADGEYWWKGVEEVVASGDIDLPEYQKKAQTVTIDSATPSLSIQPNKNYVLSNNAITDITLTACEQSMEETTIQFTTGSPAPTLTDNSGLVWFSGIPTLQTNTTYVIVIFNKQAFYQEN